MTMGVDASTPRFKGYLMQMLMLLSINVPTISFGLAMGWVSLASGESGEGSGEDDVTLVGAAAATFAAGLLGVPLGARALHAGRKPAVIVTSAAFGVCWLLKLAGGWGIVAGRLVAGVAGAAAWCISPLLAQEMCSTRVRGAAVAALVLAHNLGILLMYLAGDAGVQHRTVVFWCLGLSVVHCVTFMFAPESPAFLAACGKHKEARASLAWLRGVDVDHPSLEEEMQALPSPEETPVSPLQLTKEMLSDFRRRRAFIIGLVAVVGQEACGVLTLLQFAERVFVLARDEGGTEPWVEGGEGRVEAEAAVLATPARHAVVLGVVQFIASGVALYLVERVGRRPLLIFGAVTTGAFLALGAGWVCAGWGGWWAGGALAAAVGADSLGLQPAPYALLADMFHYQYRGCAVLLVMLAACVGNAAETLLFPLVARAAGLWAALALAAAATLFYSLFAIICVPETKGRSPEEIYDAICPVKSDNDYQKDPEDSHNDNYPEKPDHDDVRKKDTEHIQTDTRPCGNGDLSKDVSVIFDKAASDIAYYKLSGASHKNQESSDVNDNHNYSDVITSKTISNRNEDEELHNHVKLSYESGEGKNDDGSRKLNEIFIIPTTTMIHEIDTCAECSKKMKGHLEENSEPTYYKNVSELKSPHSKDSFPNRNVKGVTENGNDSSTSLVTVQTSQHLHTNQKCSNDIQCSKM